LSVFDQQYGDSSYTCNGIGISSLSDELGLPLTERAVKVLVVAQAVQDDGEPWGAALERAEREANNPAYSDELPS
jgi:hypothetical protein